MHTASCILSANAANLSTDFSQCVNFFETVLITLEIEFFFSISNIFFFVGDKSSSNGDGLG